MEYKDNDVWLLQGDSSKELSKLLSESVDLIVTSPPYAKQRGYNGYDASAFNDFLMPILNECKRVLKDSGSLVLNIKEHCSKGQRSLYVYHLVIAMVEAGWRLVDEFVWYKTNPFPTGSSKRLKDSWERIFHFTKSNNYKFLPNEVLIPSESKWLESDKKRKNKGEHKTTNGSNMNMSKRVVSDMVRPSNVIKGSTSNTNIAHPAVYPLYIPEFFIKLMSEEGDTILDPFLGSGTTGISAINLNRNFIGIELDSSFFDLSKKRILGE